MVVTRIAAYLGRPMSRSHEGTKVEREKEKGVVAVCLSYQCHPRFFLFMLGNN